MIDEMWIITLLVALVAALFAVLVLVLGWMGNKLYNRLSEIVTTMRALETALHGRVSKVDRRVAVVETKHASHLEGHPV